MSVPEWLYYRLLKHGGNVPFHQYMNWVLHDPIHGAYGNGSLDIGIHGDFVTSPSLDINFAHLIIVQVEQWLASIGDGPLSIIETGPGEGHLALQLAKILYTNCPPLRNRIEIILVEPNRGMNRHQSSYLTEVPLPLSWISFEELIQNPLQGIVISHEVLDALAIERIVYSQSYWYRQRVALSLNNTSAMKIILMRGEFWNQNKPNLKSLGVNTLITNYQNGWCTELHTELNGWLDICKQGISKGYLLVIDYLIEAYRYYNIQRSQGTIMSYGKQIAQSDPLKNPGKLDITAHICFETLLGAAANCGWSFTGQIRQGEALLALGLAQKYYALHSDKKKNITTTLASRETLLRLVNPLMLGDFRWVAFSHETATAQPLFLAEPGKQSVERTWQ
uniref:Protein arginine methyltransferase NDUFAF7 n=1 Tax=Paulinella chromatophora TaxID=39717 RepID=B1X3Q3_PAUCH|nr:hypothetical protein PCC_0120 [Paulinella chromatophora]ACB42572.1 hypothetical protein PCC_0120 [Paulinella chromatophora]